MVINPSLRDMLQAGVHFGHKTSRWHPAMDKYIFTAKSGVHVINLEETAKQLGRASEFLAQLSASGKAILFVGTKKQATAIVQKAALACDMPYINFRWLGGTLTNFNIISTSIEKYKKNRETLESGAESKLSKRDLTMLKKEVEKGERIFGGLVNMKERPSALILIGAHDEKNALHEARVVRIPTVALVDTNTDPNLVDYPVPANDDATKSIELFTNYFSAIIKENKAKVVRVDKE